MLTNELELTRCYDIHTPVKSDCCIRSSSAFRPNLELEPESKQLDIRLTGTGCLVHP